MLKEKLKKLIPHLVAVIIFIVLTSIYFSPQLEGYNLRQGDTEQHVGMSKEITDYRAMYGKEPLWSNSMFSGMPAYQISTKHPNFVTVVDNIILKPLSRPIGYIVLGMIGFYILLLCFGVNPWISIIGAIAFGFASVNMLYIAGGHNSKVHAIALLPTVLGGLLLAYRRNMILGAVLFSLFLSLQLSANHLQMTYYGMFLIAFIIFVELYRHIKEKMVMKFVKISSVLLVGAVLGVLPTFSNLVTTYEYGKYSTRGKSELTISPTNDSRASSTGNALEPWYITQYNMGVGETWSVIIPNVKGGTANYIGNNKEALENVDPQYRDAVAQSNTYWGEQAFSGGAFYFGITMFVLFILGLVFIKDPIKWAFLAASVLSAVLSWKYGLIQVFIEHFPWFNKFRDTKMMLILMQIAFSFVGVLFIREMFSRVIEKKKLLYALLAINGLLLLFYIMPTTFFAFVSNAETTQFDEQVNTYPQYREQINTMVSELETARIAIFKKDVLRSLFFALLMSGLVYFFVLGKIKKNYLLALIGVLVLIDLWAVDKRYLNNEQTGSSYKMWVDRQQYMNPFRPSAADNFILSDEMQNNPELKQKIEASVSQAGNQVEKEKVAFRELNYGTDYRVLLLPDPFNTGSVSYFHKAIGGYHGAKLKKYQELIDFYLSGELRTILNALNDSTVTLEKIYSLLQSQTPVLNMLNTKYIIYNPGEEPFVNQNTNGNSWFVKDMNFVDNADAEMLALGKVDLKTTAVINKKYQEVVKPPQFDSTASIQLTSYLPNHLTYKSKTNTTQVAVFSEVFYPKGWNAYIDGQKVEYFSANYVLRAMNIPAGEHTIEFKFEPQSYKIGSTVSLAGSILLLLLVIGTLGWSAYKEFKK